MSKSSLRDKVSRFAHRSLNALGLQVRLMRNLRGLETRAWVLEEARRWQFLERYEIRKILDVGANEGQFAALMRRHCPAATIHSFEPLPEVFAELTRQFAGDSQVIAHNIALADRAGRSSMNRSNFSPSSSLLSMTDAHKSEWPASASQEAVTVELLTLDTWAQESGFVADAHTLVKLDVQGFEVSVLRGGPDTLAKARVAVVEVSFVELYEQQPLFAEVHAEMLSLGYRFTGIVEQYFSEASQRILFADAIFENARMEARS